MERLSADCVSVHDLQFPIIAAIRRLFQFFSYQCLALSVIFYFRSSIRLVSVV